MKKIFVLLCSMLVFGLFGGQAALAAQKVGFVDPQRVLNESKIGQAAQADLAKLGQEKDRRIRESEGEIQQAKAKLTAGGLSKAEEQAQVARLEALYERHERLIQKSNEDISFEEARLIHFIMSKADESLKAVARENGFSIVLTDPDVIGYIDASADITDEVINALNRKE